MKEFQYFYFAEPKLFEYPLSVKLHFRVKDKTIPIFQKKKDKSLWIEEPNYNYYGESVKCLVLQKSFDFDVMYDLFINSSLKQNVFGSINYMLQYFKEEFLKSIEKETITNFNTDIILSYFKTDITQG